MELVILIIIGIFIITYRKNEGEKIYETFLKGVTGIYDKYAPFSFKTVRQKSIELGEEYTTKQYITQIVLFGGFGAGVGYLYFYSIFWAIFYGTAAVLFIPYLAYLRCKRVYSEFVFEQIQVYTTNVIMEFNTTQSFVKALEGVRDSGVLENPVLDDVKKMIQMSYDNGTIDESINYFNEKYPYYMVKNMHQLFYQITKEGSRDAGESLENMSLDIDALVESVYRDRMDRANFHKKFLTFGMALFLLAAVMQFLLGKDSYIKLLDMWYVQLILHLIIIINCYFLLTGEKYYNEDVGVE